MVTVGIRNLKDSLSRYLKMVKNGEHVLVTDHNRIIAEIIPASAHQETETRLDKYLNEQIEAGAITPATKRTEIRTKKNTTAKITQHDITKTYDETRGDRC